MCVCVCVFVCVFRKSLLSLVQRLEGEEEKRRGRGGEEEVGGEEGGRGVGGEEGGGGRGGEVSDPGPALGREGGGWSVAENVTEGRRKGDLTTGAAQREEEVGVQMMSSRHYTPRDSSSLPSMLHYLILT